MESSVIFSLLSVFLISLAFLGYGQIIAAGLLQKIGLNWGQKALLGFAFFITLCGYVELFKIGSRTLFWVYLGIGVLLGLFALIQLPAKFSMKLRLTSVRILALALLIIASLLYLCNLLYLPFNPGDDYTSYIVFPIRVLTEGFQGGDPFNQRGIEQGFGGGGAINALYLSLIPLGHLHIAEAGTGLLLLIGLALSHIYFQNARFWSVLAGGTIALIVGVFVQSTNIAPILSGCALAYGVLLLYVQSSQAPVGASYQRSIFLGILLAALLLLKGNLFVPMVVFGGSFYIARLLQIQKWWVVQEFLITAITIITCLFPWLVSNVLYHGTAFYPLLGKGLSYSGGFGLVTLPETINAIGEFIPLYGLLLVSGLTFISYSRSQSQIRYAMLMIIFVILSTAFMSLTPAGMYRYSYVILATPSAFLLNCVLAIPNKQFKAPIYWLKPLTCKRIFTFIVVVTSVLMLNQTKRVGRNFFKEGLYSRYFKTPDQLASNGFLSPNFAKEKERYIALQNSVPSGEILLVQVPSPFMLDYSRNLIYVMDYPGNAGPRPGPPFNQSAESLAQYLRDNQIRYLAHAYAQWNIQKFDPYFIDSCLNAAGEWGRTLASRQLLVNEQMLELAKHYHVVFDDQQNRVIDLGAPIENRAQ